jgi:aminoglycoside phosphotransferase (APT) family kinase protein
MQMSIHYSEEDQYLIDKLEKEANQERKSKSAMVLSILEEYFEAQQKLGEILKDMRAIDAQQLQRALKLQRERERKKKLGEIMLEEDYVEKVDLDKALAVQSRHEGGESN